MTINHHALPPPNLSETKLLAKMPISNHATQPPCPPLSQLRRTLSIGLPISHHTHTAF